MKMPAQEIAEKRTGANFRPPSGSSQLPAALALFAIVAALAIAMGLSSCAGYTTNAASTGSQSGSAASVLSASSTSVDFGTVPVGSSATQNLTLTDSGTDSVTISSVSVSGTGFSVVGGGFSGSVAASQSVNVQLEFAPQAAGSNSGTVTVASDASSSNFRISLHGNATQAHLSMSPSSVTFNDVSVGQSSTQSVALTNNGTANLQIASATVTGAGFSIAGLTFPETIPSGQGISFTVQYAPPSAGSASGSISFSDNAPASPQSLRLTGTAVAAAGTLSANPGSYNFNDVAVGSSSKEAITLTNSGATTVRINQVAASGSGFSVTGISAGQTIAAGTQASFTATFAPTASGDASGSITLSTNASNPSLSIPLTGTGTQGALSVNPASVNFGSVAVGNSGSSSVTLRNSGTAPVSVSAASASGTGFTVSGFTAGTLNPGSTTSFTVNFTPAAEGSATGSVSITNNASGSPTTIALNGTGLQALGSASPGSVAFGSVVVGNSDSSVVTLKNTGNATLSFSQVSVRGSGFSISGLTTSSTVPAGGSLNFDAIYDPTSATPSSGSIALATNGSPAQISISLTGSGAAATESLSLSPSTLNFGNVQVGSSNSLTTTVKNTGNSNLSISGVTVSAGYTASGVTSGMTLTPNQSVTLTVVFTPTGLGSDPGTVSIASNATGSPTTISLNGESHTVLLSWTASTSSGVTGYYVYRATQTGQYAKINPSSPASGTQFTDTGVAAGTTYNYVVTAVDSSGTESPYSSPATVSVP